jgi:hypothetical protein
MTINNLSEINEVPDEVVTEAWEDMICENAYMKQELERWNQVIGFQLVQHHTTGVYNGVKPNKRGIIRMIQFIFNHYESKQKQFVSQMERFWTAILQKAKHDSARTEYYKDRMAMWKKALDSQTITIVDVYSSVYAALRTINRQFALVSKDIQGSKIDYIMQHPDMAAQCMFIATVMYQHCQARLEPKATSYISSMLNELILAVKKL